jgi:Rv2525c-like, glycoside hydrolase-like domain
MSAIANARVQQLVAGARGFDTAQRLSAPLCRAFKLHGYEFAYRYVWRDPARPHPFDLTADEVEIILGSGLGLGIVQHYAGDGWTPSAALGARYGGTAAAACASLGIPPDVTAFCDLEGVLDGVSMDDVEAYGRTWARTYLGAGRTSVGLYVGDHDVLGPQRLYGMPFSLYWRAENLDDDRIPATRGFAMRQQQATASDVPPNSGMTTADFDVNVVSGDLLGGFPSVLMPGVLV